jgi:hypothetical protein
MRGAALAFGILLATAAAGAAATKATISAAQTTRAGLDALLVLAQGR